MMRWQGITALGKESTYGRLAPYTRVIAVNTGSCEVTRVAVEDERATSSRYQYRSVLTGLDYSFSFEVWAVPDMIGEILLFTLGSVTTSPSNSKYRHDFSVAESLPSFSLYVDHGLATNPTFQLAGAKVGTLTIESAARGVTVLRTEGNGRSHSWGSAINVDSDTVDSFTKNPLIFSHLIFSKAFGNASPARDVEVERFALTINNNLVTDKITADGSLYIYNLPEGILEVTGSFEKEFNSTTEFNSFVENERLNIEAVFESEEGTLGFKLPDCRITSLPLPEIAGSSERQTFTVDFRAIYDTTSATSISAYLINSVSSYS